jgi:phage terminase small subunit
VAAGKLTPKQEAFVREYMIDLNATQAAIRAGYSEKTANRIGAENLSKPVIQEAIRVQRTAQEVRTQISADRVLRELARVAFADATDLAFIEDGHVRLRDSSTLSEDQRAAVAYIKDGAAGPEVRLYDKIKALELIGKHLGMFDKRDDTDSQCVNVTFEAEMEGWSE